MMLSMFILRYSLEFELITPYSAHISPKSPSRLRAACYFRLGAPCASYHDPLPGSSGNWRYQQDFARPRITPSQASLENRPTTGQREAHQSVEIKLFSENDWRRSAPVNHSCSHSSSSFLVPPRTPPNSPPTPFCRPLAVLVKPPTGSPFPSLETPSPRPDVMPPTASPAPYCFELCQFLVHEGSRTELEEGVDSPYLSNTPNDIS
jgi:hypothetical protein